MTPERRQTPTWQWIARVLVTVLIGTAAYAYQDVQAKIEKLDREKLDKEVFLQTKQDVKDIKEMMFSHIMATGAGKARR